MLLLHLLVTGLTALWAAWSQINRTSLVLFSPERTALISLVLPVSLVLYFSKNKLISMLTTKVGVEDSLPFGLMCPSETAPVASTCPRSAILGLLEPIIVNEPVPVQFAVEDMDNTSTESFDEAQSGPMDSSMKFPTFVFEQLEYGPHPLPQTVFTPTSSDAAAPASNQSIKFVLPKIDSPEAPSTPRSFRGAATVATIVATALCLSLAVARNVLYNGLSLLKALLGKATHIFDTRRNTRPQTRRPVTPAPLIKKEVRVSPPAGRVAIMKPCPRISKEERERKLKAQRVPALKPRVEYPNPLAIDPSAQEEVIPIQYYLRLPYIPRAARISGASASRIANVAPRRELDAEAVRTTGRTGYDKLTAGNAITARDQVLPTASTSQTATTANGTNSPAPSTPLQPVGGILRGASSQMSTLPQPHNRPQEYSRVGNVNTESHTTERALPRRTVEVVRVQPPMLAGQSTEEALSMKGEDLKDLQVSQGASVQGSSLPASHNRPQECSPVDTADTEPHTTEEPLLQMATEMIPAQPPMLVEKSAEQQPSMQGGEEHRGARSQVSTSFEPYKKFSSVGGIVTEPYPTEPLLSQTAVKMMPAQPPMLVEKSTEQPPSMKSEEECSEPVQSPPDATISHGSNVSPTVNSGKASSNNDRVEVVNVKVKASTLPSIRSPTVAKGRIASPPPGDSVLGRASPERSNISRSAGRANPLANPEAFKRLFAQSGLTARTEETRSPPPRVPQTPQNDAKETKKKRGRGKRGSGATRKQPPRGQAAAANAEASALAAGQSSSSRLNVDSNTEGGKRKRRK